MEVQKIQDANLQQQGDVITKTGRSYESVLCNVAGLLVSLSLVVYFLVMKALGLEGRVNLRYFNGVFFLAGMFATFFIYYRKTGRIGIDYFKGLRMGVQVAFMAALPFAIFMGLYLQFNPEFMNHIRQSIEYGTYATPFLTAAGLFVEGFVGATLIAFVLLPIFKSR
jgi:hypothetical protein